MKIEDRMHQYEVGKQPSQTTGKGMEDTVEKSREKPSSSTAAGRDAVVHFSQASKEVNAARSIIDETPEVRTEKVAALKKSVQDGTYRPDMQKVADKLVDSMLGEIV